MRRSFFCENCQTLYEWKAARKIKVSQWR
jgi:hypothetical protein